MYVDPTGHWQESDKDLKQDARIAISRLTDIYYSTKDPAVKAQCASQANEIRNNPNNKATEKQNSAVGKLFDAEKKKDGSVSADDWLKISNTYNGSTSQNAISSIKGVVNSNAPDGIKISVVGNTIGNITTGLINTTKVSSQITPTPVVPASNNVNSNLKANGQDKNFSEYGGIEDPTKYVNAEYGTGWTESKSATISGIENFTQAKLKTGENNCTLASITRIMKYYSDSGYSKIPSDIGKIYKKVEEIGYKHGYDPKKTGLFRDIFVYTPWEINNMAEEAWDTFGYPSGDADNDYIGKLDTVKSNIDNSNPLLLNIVSGDYAGHTVSVIGYKIYSQNGKGDKTFVQVYDGWSDTIRYIDWEKFGGGPTTSNLTRFLPPSKK